MKNEFVPFGQDNTQLVEKKLFDYNQERSPEKGFYCILPPTSKTLYYTLWFNNPQAEYHPHIFIRNLELNLPGSVSMAFRFLENSYLPLRLVEEIEDYQNSADDIIMFGKYRGHHLQDIFTVDPRYIQWIADKFTPIVRGEYRFKELAGTYTKVYLDLLTKKRYKAAVSNFVGNQGDKLIDLKLTILKVRLEDDSYRTRLTNGMVHFYVDQLITAVDEGGNIFHFVIKAKDRSLQTKVLAAAAHAFRPQEIVRIKTAKVLKHYLSHNTKCTKIGYINFAE